MAEVSKRPARRTIAVRMDLAIDPAVAFRDQGTSHQATFDIHPSGTQETARNMRQMQRNITMAQNTGMGVIYKVPKGHDKAARQIEALASELGMPAGALQVLKI